MDSVASTIQMNHTLIMDILQQIQLLTRSYKEAKPKIRALQSAVFKHFEIQKKSFYDGLLEKLQYDKEQAKILEFLIHDLKDLKIKTLVFFDAHPADMGDLRPKNFIQDFHNFSAELTARIRMENEYLIPLLEQE